ncbi:unnamed protein product [Blepharisma stoltei]|uniref:LSM12 anticodon-binding domain-containing protein n=1 Tax=Blepharisma stoltei TaxID=1481888 RepID=A0AAU9JP58_9CILI|nr:unnamed protein product [Blepharisma stoltei]
MSSLSYTEMVGMEIKVITTLDEEHKGRIYTIDEDANVVILYRGNENSRDYVFVNTEYIKDIVVLDRERHRVDTEIPYIDVNRFLEDISRQMEKDSQNAGQINELASPEGQQIFNEISRTYKCDWDGVNIYLVDLDVKICAPYSSENVTGNPSAVHRISNVLIQTRRKLNLD